MHGGQLLRARAGGLRRRLTGRNHTLVLAFVALALVELAVGGCGSGGGATDAGQADAASDAEVRDGGGDAATADASSDGGTDVGRLDAGRHDAGGPDGGPTCGSAEDCAAGEVCRPASDGAGSCAIGCLIADAFVELGGTAPGPTCRTCDPTRRTDDWSPLPAGRACRASSGPCDLAEVCDGEQMDCPADERAATTQVCRPPGFVTDPSGALVRVSSGECDEAETCDGFSADCPPDTVRAVGSVCRPSAGVCDPVEEACDGVLKACPTDAVAPEGTSCGTAGSCAAGVCREP